jgi:DNA-binding transcriptional MocR family regulator
MDAPDAAPQRCPKYLRLAKRFERQLATGVLRIGDRLPSVRQLRDEHRVSVATAIGCYAWLERQGYIRARPKSGFYVSRAPTPDGPPPAVAVRPKGPVPVRLTGTGADGPADGGRADAVQLGRRHRTGAASDEPPEPLDPDGPLGLRRQRRPADEDPRGTRACAGRSPASSSARAPPALRTRSS